jgi:transposase
MPRISEADRIAICMDRHAGMTYAQLAEKYEISINGAQKVCVKRSLFGTVRDRPRAGRPRILTAADERRLVREVLANPKTPISKVVKVFTTHTGGRVSPSTAQKTVKRLSLFPYRPVPKPLLKPHHKKARLEWAKQHEHWTEKDWRKVLFSDETKINRISSDDRVRIWCRKVEPLSEKRITPREQQGGGGLLMWGCMSWAGFANGVVPDEKVNSDVYTAILEEHLKASANSCFGSKQFIFQQDNASVHISKVTNAWIKKNKIKVLPWPAKSPDMNPIEHFWDKLKSIVREFPPAADKEELWKHVEGAIEWSWSQEGIEYAHKLVDSMPIRVQALIKAKGGYTKY